MSNGPLQGGYTPVDTDFSSDTELEDKSDESSSTDDGGNDPSPAGDDDYAHTMPAVPPDPDDGSGSGGSSDSSDGGGASVSAATPERDTSELRTGAGVSLEDEATRVNIRNQEGITDPKTLQQASAIARDDDTALQRQALLESGPTLATTSETTSADPGVTPQTTGTTTSDPSVVPIPFYGGGGGGVGGGGGGGGGGLSIGLIAAVGIGAYLLLRGGS